MRMRMPSLMDNLLKNTLALLRKIFIIKLFYYFNNWDRFAQSFAPLLIRSIKIIRRCCKNYFYMSTLGETDCTLILNLLSSPKPDKNKPT